MMCTVLVSSSYKKSGLTKGSTLKVAFVWGMQRLFNLVKKLIYKTEWYQMINNDQLFFYFSHRRTSSHHLNPGACSEQTRQISFWHSMQLNCGAPSHSMLQIYIIQGLLTQVYLLNIITWKRAISGSCKLKILGDCEGNLGHDLHILTL